MLDPTSADYSPLDIAIMHPKENISEFSALYNRIERFIILKIHEITGMSLPEFLSMPREYVELVFRISAHKAKGDYKTQENIANEVKQTMGLK